MPNHDDSSFNLGVERAILSALIFSPGELDTLEGLPSPTAFYSPSHRNIYEAILGLHRQDLPVDEEFIKMHLIKINSFDEVSMIEVLSASPISDIKSYIIKLENLEKRRKLYRLSLEIQRELEEQDNSTDVLEFIDNRLLDIGRAEEKKQFLPISSIISEAVSHVQMMNNNPSTLIGFDTGIEGLNELTGGFMPGDLIIIASRPGVGKSALATGIMINSSKAGNGVALHSLEMPKEQLSLRMLSMESGIPLQRLRNGKVSPQEIEQMNDAARKIESLDIHIDDTSIVYLGTLRSKIKRLIARNTNIKIVIIDYLQLIENSSKKDRHLQVGDISRSLKIIAKELGIAIVALSQVNRHPEARSNKRPQLGDLRESGSLEQDADIIMFLYNEEIYKKLSEDEKAAKHRQNGVPYTARYKVNPVSVTELIIGKQRNGPLDTLLLDFIKDNTLFIEHT